MAKLYAIQTSPGKGRGIFATKGIAGGMLIMKDRVALKIHKEGPSVREADVLKGFNLLSKADQDSFLALHEGNRQYECKVFRIWKGMCSLGYNSCMWKLTAIAANVFGGQNTTTLYFEVSLINHSCVPNAAFSSMSNHAEIVALKQIAKDEEIFISYNSIYDMLSKHHRAIAMRMYYGFECSCSACSLPSAQQEMSDARRQLLNVVTNALKGFQPIDTKIFDYHGTLDGKQAEHPTILNGISRLPLAKPLSLGQKNAYCLLRAGLLVAEGHSIVVIADAFADLAEKLLRRMQVVDDVISLDAVMAVETWMRLALRFTRDLCGKNSKQLGELEQLWRRMINTDQMSAGLLFFRKFSPEKKVTTFAIRLGEVENGGLKISELSEPEYRMAVREKRRRGLLS